MQNNFYYYFIKSIKTLSVTGIWLLSVFVKCVIRPITGTFYILAFHSVR